MRLNIAIIVPSLMEFGYPGASASATIPATDSAYQAAAENIADLDASAPNSAVTLPAPPADCVGTNCQPLSPRIKRRWWSNRDEVRFYTPARKGWLERRRERKALERRELEDQANVKYILDSQYVVPQRERSVLQGARDVYRENRDLYRDKLIRKLIDDRTKALYAKPTLGEKLRTRVIRCPNGECPEPVVYKVKSDGRRARRWNGRRRTVVCAHDCDHSAVAQSAGPIATATSVPAVPALPDKDTVTSPASPVDILQASTAKVSEDPASTPVLTQAAQSSPAPSSVPSKVDDSQAATPEGALTAVDIADVKPATA